MFRGLSEITHERATIFKSYRYITFVLLLAVIFLCGCGDRRQLSDLGTEGLILAFGDSLTYGTGVQSENSYPSALAELTGLAVINAGVPGEVTAEGLRRLPEQLKQHRPDLVIICHGGNDILRKLPLDQAENNLRTMIELSREAGVSVVLVAVPRFGVWKSSPDFYTRVADDLKVPIEEAILPELEFDPAMKSDPIHLNEQGYRKFAEALARLLKKHGALNLIDLAR